MVSVKLYYFSKSSAFLQPTNQDHNRATAELNSSSLAVKLLNWHHVCTIYGFQSTLGICIFPSLLQWRGRYLRFWGVAFTWKKKKTKNHNLGIAASMLINIIKEERNVLKPSHINGKWQNDSLDCIFQFSSPLPRKKTKQLCIGDFATFSTPKCFFLPNTSVLLHTDFLIRSQENRAWYILKQREASQKTYQCVSPCGFARIIF